MYLQHNVLYVYISKNLEFVKNIFYILYGFINYNLTDPLKIDKIKKSTDSKNKIYRNHTIISVLTVSE